MDRVPDFGLYVEILRTLEWQGIPYVIIGAFAATSYGVTRLTYDVDIVVRLTDAQVDNLADEYPAPRYYADPEQMRSSIAQGILFNIIDTSEGVKADLIPIAMAPGYEWAMRNRVRRPVPLVGDETFEAWFACPEDVIVGKLMAWKEGRSHKHESDIRDMLVAIRTGEEPPLTEAFDLQYLERWVDRLGPEVRELWDEIKRAADLAG